VLRAVWALCRVGSEQNPTPTPLFLLHIIYKNSHLPLYLPTTLLHPSNTITHHQPLALKINIKHFFQWKKSGFLENTLLSFILKNFFGDSWKQPEIERPFIWLTQLSNLSLNKFLKFSPVFFFSFKSIFKASNSAANLQMKGLLKTKHHLIKLFLNDHLWFSSAKKHHAQQKWPHFKKKA